MPLTHLYFVSSNQEKYREIHGALSQCGVTVERIDLDVPEIQGIDPAQVAEYKAHHAHSTLSARFAVPCAVLVEDTGLGIDAWQGYPGALVKWVTRAIGEEGLCRQLDAWPDRSATATVVLCLYDGHTTRRFVGQTHGTITLTPRGELGFGWDSIFQPDGYDRTYGEMPREAKMGISMRARALDQLRAFLQSQDG